MVVPPPPPHPAVSTRWVLQALRLASGVWGQGAARSHACLMERRPQLDQQVLPDGSGCGRGGQGPGSWVLP